MQTGNAVNWFEIRATDLDRAQRFYEAILGKPLRREMMGDTAMAVLPYGEGAVGGCLVAGPPLPPGNGAVLIYLSAEPRLDAVLARIGAAGGAILTPRTELCDGMGAYAVIRDSEGNHVGLHALQ